jgi:LysR family transcriptional regulator, transcriptional activator of the cysJI operon
MDFEQIRAFVNVAHLKSFSEAAEKMYISQPSVSIRVKALEDELGVVLLDRSKAREPSLTEAGIIFLDYAQALLNLRDECRERLSGVREKAEGLIYIGASTVPGTYLLPGLLSAFKAESSAIDFSIDILDTSAVLEGILDYSYQVGFVGLVQKDERLIYMPLVKDELVFCTKKGTLSPEQLTEGIPVCDLTAYHLVMREKGSATRQLLEKQISENGLTLKSFAGVTYINSLEGVKQAVCEGLGAAVLSALSVRDIVKAEAVDICPVNGISLERSLYLVHHRSRVLGAAAGRFRDFVTGKFVS